MRPVTRPAAGWKMLPLALFLVVVLGFCLGVKLARLGHAPGNPTSDVRASLALFRGWAIPGALALLALAMAMPAAIALRQGHKGAALALLVLILLPEPLVRAAAALSGIAALSAWSWALCGLLRALPIMLVLLAVMRRPMPPLSELGGLGVSPWRAMLAVFLPAALPAAILALLLGWVVIAV